MLEVDGILSGIYNKKKHHLASLLQNTELLSKKAFYYVSLKNLVNLWQAMTCSEQNPSATEDNVF